MKVRYQIFRHMAELILQMSTREVESIKVQFKLKDVSEIMIGLYTKEELNKALLDSIISGTLPILMLDGIPIQLDMVTVSSMIRGIEEKDNEKSIVYVKKYKQ